MKPPTITKRVAITLGAAVVAWACSDGGSAPTNSAVAPRDVVPPAFQALSHECLQTICVTPDNYPGPTVPANTSGQVAYFEAHNTFLNPAYFRFTCGSSGGVSCVDVVPDSTWIGAQSSTWVQVYWGSTTPGSAVLYLVGAANGYNDPGNWNITVVP